MGTGRMTVEPRIHPVLDPDFLPAVLWRKAYREACAADPGSHELAISVGRPDGTLFVARTQVLPHTGSSVALNENT